MHYSHHFLLRLIYLLFWEVSERALGTKIHGGDGMKLIPGSIGQLKKIGPAFGAIGAAGGFIADVLQQLAPSHRSLCRDGS